MYHSYLLETLLERGSHLSGPVVGFGNGGDGVDKGGAVLDDSSLTPHPYVYGYRSELGLYQAMSGRKHPIIDLTQTIRCLRRACRFVHGVLLNGGHCLFVNSNPDYTAVVKQTSLLLGQKYINTKWIGGLLSRERVDCIIVVNANRTSTAIEEAFRLGIPIIAVVDSTVSKHIQRQISYPIPANVESVHFVYILCNCILKGVLRRGL
jgi:ribosomal protein S2